LNSITTRRGGSPKPAKWVVARLVAPLVLLSTLLMTVASVAAYYVHRLQREATEVLTRDISGIRAAEELVITIRQIETHVDPFLVTRDRRHLNPIFAYHTEVDRWLAEAKRWLQEAGRLKSTTEERAYLEKVRTSLEEFWKTIAEHQAEGPEVVESDEATRDRLEHLFKTQLLDMAQNYLDAMEDEVETASEQNLTMQRRVAVLLFSLGLSGAVAGLVAGFGIARGVHRTIAQLSIPIRDAAGKLNEVVGPITLSRAWDVESLEEVLREMAHEIGTVVERLEVSRREQLRGEQFAALGQMAAGLAHELRNPLTSMKILVQSAVERGEEGVLRSRALEILSEEISRLEDLIQWFLNFAKPPEVKKRPFDLCRMLEQVLSLVASQAALKSIDLEFDPPDPPIILEADAGHLRQVLLNLLMNAMDATLEEGTILVEVLTEPAPPARSTESGATPDENTGWLSILVSDSGGGLPSNLGDRIFEPFISTKETGLGLGLSISKRIIEDHGGRLTAADRPGGGAVFTIQLPIKLTTAPDPASSMKAR